MEIPTKYRKYFRPFSRVRSLVERSKLGSRSILSDADSNNYILSQLHSGARASIGKIGAAELGGLRRFRSRASLGDICTDWGHHKTMLYRNAGVFPAESEALSQFCITYENSISKLSAVCVWHQWGESKLVKLLAPSAKLITLTGLDPFYHSAPWTSGLSGARVVVVSPFADLIAEQYAQRARLWPTRPLMLPEFSLVTLRCPLSAAIATPEDLTWHATLTRLKSLLDDLAYDVLIVGAGAWSLPLLAHSKESGKFAIHLGGSTQILFGIKGARWDSHPIISSFYNSSWIRPAVSSRPAAFEAIEGGCYW